MRFEVDNTGFFQAVLLLLGAAMVLMPLLTLTEQKAPLQIDKAGAQETVTAGTIAGQDDFTKLGVSKVDAIFILRQERKNSPVGRGT